MRKINWHNFKESGIIHDNVRRWNRLSAMREIQFERIILFDQKGRVYHVNANLEDDFDIEVEAALKAEMPGNWQLWNGGFCYSFIINRDGYCFMVSDKRLSSLPEHEKQFGSELWLTTADRDMIFNQVVKGTDLELPQ